MSSLPDGLAVEINFEGVGDDVMIFNDATRGKFDTGTFGGGATFVDVTQYVRSFSTSRGVSRQDGPYAKADAGRATVVLDNLDARFDPTNLSGPYVAAGESQVQPMRAFRIRADGQDIWRGFADAWTLSYPMGGKDAVTVLTGTDGTKVLAQVDKLAGSLVGSGEDTGARIDRILDNADWPAADRDLDTGLTTVQSTQMAQPAWTEIVLTADTEFGEVYFDATGKLVFRNRHAILTESRSSTSQATFGDGVSELPYVGLELAHDDTQLANLVRIARVGGTEQTATASASESPLGSLTRTFERSDLVMQTDAVAEDYADWTLSIVKDGELRFDSVTVDPRKDPVNLYPQVLGRELGDRITVKWTPPGRPGDPIERDVFIRGIAHAGSPDSWVTTWALQDASRFDFAVVGTAIVGSSKVAF